jgi:predicted RNA binding protein YcfA (HicA-like mRNA interferase family)
MERGINPDKIIKALIQLVFSEVGQSGSHKIFKNESNKYHLPQDNIYIFK